MKYTSKSVSGKSKSKPFYAKIFLPMVFLTLIQFFTFVIVLMFGGEFSYIKKYAYNTLVEKTANRKNYVENVLNQKTSLVNETSLEINDITRKILEENNLTIDDISRNKDLSKKILSDSAENLIYLLRRNMVNDAFIILDTGELYCDEKSVKKAGMYIRDIDTSENSINNNSDLLMEMGNSETAHNLGIALDYEWSLHLNLTENKDNNFDFYFDTIKNAGTSENSRYGHWTGFSKISDTAQPSMKYTIPLVFDDGTVYGVLGIGLMEKIILKNMPSNDFFSECACYILGLDDDNDGEYSVVMHSGAVFTKLVDENTVISKENKVKGDIYNFNPDGKIKSVGNIQQMNIYTSDSPYKNQKWALISIAEKSKVLNIYTTLIKLFVISSIISMVFSTLCAVIINRSITNPVARMIQTLNERTLKSSFNEKTSQIVSFSSSGIDEVDKLGEAIKKLQVTVVEQASRVSRIISMVDMGIGVFMYDCITKDVFVGESLIKLFRVPDIEQEDKIISFDDFRNFIKIIDREDKICSHEIFSEPHNDDTYGESISIEVFYKNPENKTASWFKFTLMRDKSNVLGLVQDITKIVIEKKKIEYERDYDITTGLLNRRAYYNKIDEMFANPRALKVSAFIMWDLDNLKYVNDTYGHDFGDDYIKTAANIFKTFRDYGGIVARMSGDEFNVFLSGFDSKDEIRKIISEVRDKLNESYCILADGTHYKIRASGGISWYPDDSPSYELLIKYADFAMYTIKHSTKGNIAEFNISLYSKDSILITGIEEMNRIIDEQSIKYSFQSIVSAKTGEIYGYEALMRPQSAVLKSPLEFIRIARTGAKLYEIERLTWVLSLKNYREQIEKGNISPDKKIFINSLSNCLMKKEDISVLESENGQYLKNIVLEVLESDKTNDEYIKEKQKIVARWGAKIALDDFGSGYNSEYALITINPNLIKIDRSIISGCDRDISRTSIITNLVQIAKTKNIMVLAEGVETYNEMRTVIECGVDLLQGYYLTRPLFEPIPIDEKIVGEIRDINKKTGK
ncbi:MAG: EAL domain-containing protein [Ruminococcus sp.]|nr:EAL domain-containing protein [Ruminococcus sp.]